MTCYWEKFQVVNERQMKRKPQKTDALDKIEHRNPIPDRTVEWIAIASEKNVPLSVYGAADIGKLLFRLET